MENVKSLNKWANSHTYLPVDLVRIVLGVFLFMKGVSFVTNIQYLHDLISPIDQFGGGMFLIALHCTSPYDWWYYDCFWITYPLGNCSSITNIIWCNSHQFYGTYAF